MTAESAGTSRHSPAGGRIPTFAVSNMRGPLDWAEGKAVDSHVPGGSHETELYQ
jgi:hypothetical protein